MSALSAVNGRTERIRFNQLWWVGLLAAFAAVVANLTIYFIVQNVFGITLVGPGGPGTTEMTPVPAIAVILSSIGPAIAATALLAILGKFVARPIRVFLIVSAVFLILSFIPPLTLPVAAAIKISLAVMHVVSAIIIVGVLTTLGRDKQPLL